MRISIIGHAGSGKSTLAERISKKFSIPHLHLDRLWFEAGGHISQTTDEMARENVRNYIREKVEESIREEAWVSDGWYSHVQQLIADRADQVVFLDISLTRRLINHARRTIFGRERHTEVSLWDDIKFTRLIIRRTYLHGPAMRNFVQKNTHKVLVLSNYKQVEEYFESLN